VNLIIYESLKLFCVKNSTILDCMRLSLPLFGDRNGHITSITSLIEVPFEVKRLFYLYDLPAGESRGAHAHYDCHQLLVAVSGSFDILIDDGYRKDVVTLNRPNSGLLIVPGIWAAEYNFSSGAICLVITSDLFNEHDYIRNYDEFKEYKYI
jgi:hypothetical protein